MCAQPKPSGPGRRELTFHQSKRGVTVRNRDLFPDIHRPSHTKRGVMMVCDSYGRSRFAPTKGPVSDGEVRFKTKIALGPLDFGRITAPANTMI